MAEDKLTPDGTIPSFETPYYTGDHTDALCAKEIEFVKGLEAIIGETEGRTLVSNYSCAAVRDFVRFDCFGLIVFGDDGTEIYLVTDGLASRAKLDFMTSRLTERLPRPDKEAGPSRVIVLGEVRHELFDPLRCMSTVQPLSTAESELGFAGIFRDSAFSVREEKLFERLCSHIALTLDKIRLFDKVTELAIKDGLTGIFNHLHIVTKLEWEIARSKRYGSTLSVILFDVDNFKDINDGFGHLAGNQVLVKVAQLLKNSVRNIDSVGRYGGEEFLAVLPETEGEAAVTMAERLRKRIEDEEFFYEGQLIKLTVSGGVAGYNSDVDANRLIRTADENLFRAKKQGKNLVNYDKQR